jgi:hypothetical protein
MTESVHKHPACPVGDPLLVQKDAPFERGVATFRERQGQAYHARLRACDKTNLLIWLWKEGSKKILSTKSVDNFVDNSSL